MSSINFDNVYLLLIAIPLIVLFTVPFCIAVRKDNRNGHNITSQILHVVMAIIIAFAAAGTGMTTVLTETHVYVVADVSYSANKNLARIDDYISHLDLPANSKIGLVCFGKDSKVVGELGKQKDLPSVVNSGVDDSETNIAEALRYTGSLFENDVIKRIVLITDGRQTDQTDPLAVKNAVNALREANVKVDAIFLDDNIDENTHEVQISGADFTRAAYKNHDEKVTLTLQSTYNTNAILTLYSKLEPGADPQNEDLKMEDRTTATLSTGRNVVSFKLDTSKGGTFEYKVRVEADGDANSHNNDYDFTQTVSDDVKVLLLAGDFEGMKQLIDKYMDVEKYDDVSIDAYTPVVMPQITAQMSYKSTYDGPAADGTDPNPAVNINLMGTYDLGGIPNKDMLPATVDELCGYDEIVIAEADLSEENNGSDIWRGATSFLHALDLAVKSGKSLITLGDINIQGATRQPKEDSADPDETESKLKDLDNMLPIKFGKNDQMPNLYTIVLDVSTSLREGMRFEAAKSAAKGLLSKLQDDDEFCIVAFNGLTSIIRTPISVKAGRDSALKTLDSISLGTGTVIGYGIETAYDYVNNQKSYNNKQFLLITDGVGDVSIGREGYDGDDGIYRFVTNMRNEGIVTSTVDVGVQQDQGTEERPPQPMEDPTVDLKRLAEECGGGKYNDFSQYRAGQEPDLGDMTDSLLQYTIVGDSRVEIVNLTDEVLNGIDKTSIPAVSGFVVGYAKPSAVTVMNVSYTASGAIGEKKSPLYAYWKYGNGTVASFASAPSGDWIRNWDAASAGNKSVKDKFLDRIFDTAIPEEKTSYPYSIDIRQEESSTAVQVALADRPSDASAITMRINIKTPDGREINQNFSETGGYYYNYEFLTTVVGKYDISITYAYGNHNYVSDFHLNVSYSSEYNDFASFEPSMLNKAIAEHGQVITEGNVLKIENDPNEVGLYKVDFTIALLIICVVLYVVDIVIRKLKWEDVVSFFGGFKKSDKNAKSGGIKK